MEPLLLYNYVYFSQQILSVVFPYFRGRIFRLPEYSCLEILKTNIPTNNRLPTIITQFINSYPMYQEIFENC